MAFGLIPYRGPWEYRVSTTSSLATFPKGALLSLDPTRTVREYRSTDSNFFGVAMSHSTASIGGKVVVAIPNPFCTALSDLTTGIAQSALSFGQVVNCYKEGNYMSYASTVAGATAAESVFSGILTIANETIFSATSQVEVTFNMAQGTLYKSASTATYRS